MCENWDSKVSPELPLGKYGGDLNMCENRDSKVSPELPLLQSKGRLRFGGEGGAGAARCGGAGAKVVLEFFFFSGTLTL